MEKLHRHFNVSVSEADRDGDSAQELPTVAAVCGPGVRRELPNRVADAVAAYPPPAPRS